jgi:hypothetical protein
MHWISSSSSTSLLPCTTKRPLTCLPVDELSVITSFLSTKDKCNLFRASKHLLADSSVCLSRHGFTRSFNMLTLRKQFQHLLSNPALAAEQSCAFLSGVKMVSGPEWDECLWGDQDSEEEEPQSDSDCDYRDGEMEKQKKKVS